MSEASTGVVRVSDAISVIAAGTGQAAARMTVAAESVSSAVESIAAISEQNSAAAEDVSAATSEMSERAADVVAATGTLAQMARQLDAVVARFTLDRDADPSSTAEPITPLRKPATHALALKAGLASRVSLDAKGWS
jgi:methyl-accepting chemotaxis protein